MPECRESSIVDLEVRNENIGQYEIVRTRNIIRAEECALLFSSMHAGFTLPAVGLECRTKCTCICHALTVYHCDTCIANNVSQDVRVFGGRQVAYGASRHTMADSLLLDSQRSTDVSRINEYTYICDYRCIPQHINGSKK